MYIILKGSVNVRIKKLEIDGTYSNPVLVSLHDGTQFGEFSLVNMK